MMVLFASPIRVPCGDSKCSSRWSSLPNPWNISSQSMGPTISTTCLGKSSGPHGEIGVNSTLAILFESMAYSNCGSMTSPSRMIPEVAS